MKFTESNRKFPAKKTLKKIRDKLSEPAFEGASLLLPANASEVDRAKYELCQIIIKYLREKDLLQKELAEKLEIDDSRMSEILRGKIAGFTLDRLVGYGEKIHPGLRLRIVAA